MKKSYKLILTLLLVLVVFTGLSAVSAADVNTSDASSSISSVNTNSTTSDLLTGADYSNYQSSVDNSSDYSNEYSSNLNDVAVLSDGNTTTSNAGSYTDLANLINNSNGTVSLERNYTYNALLDGNYTDGVNITKDLVINGNGYTLSGNNQASGILNIIDTTVTLNDLNLINEKSTTGTGYGGAIAGANSNIFVNNCNLTNNYINTLGGAIYTFKCNLTVTNSTFENNSAYFYGGAIGSDSSNVTVSDCQFYDNIVNTTKIFNRTIFFGGGAIGAEYGNILVNHCSFNRNIATGNDASAYAGEGGAIILYNTTSFINNSGFSNNYANAAAGAIWSWYNTLYINNSMFGNNVAKRNGGAVLVNGNLNVNDSTFLYNTVNTTNQAKLAPYTNIQYGGGAIYQYGGDFILNYTSFIRNEATGNITNSSNGGAIFTNSALNVTNCDFENNAANIGGAIYTNNTLNIENNEFFRNTANLNGGAVFTYGNISVSNSNFTQNNASFAGGAVYSNGNITVTGSNFKNNNAIMGGAVLSDENAYVTGSYFNFNNALAGGAIYSDSNIIVNDSGFMNNTADYGGALLAPLVNVTETYFINNIAYTNGGAVYANNTNVNYCVLLNNTGNSSSIEYAGGYCNANYNWWGNNTPFNGTDYNDLIYHEINGTSHEYVKADNWVLMTLTVNNTNVTLGDTIYGIVDFKHYTDGNNTYNMTSLIPEMPVKFSCNDGYSINRTVITDNNSYDGDYHTKTVGNFTTTVSSPYQTLSYNFTVNPLTNKSTVLYLPADIFMYGNNTYVGTLLDSNGNPVVYRTVSLNLTRISTGAWKVYNVTTNIYGEFSLPIRLGVGEYLVKGSFAGDSDYNGSMSNGFIVVKNGYINTSNINATYGDNINYTGYLYDCNNNTLANKTVEVSIIRTATGQWKVYNVTTDSNGMFSLPIHLNPGNYYLEASYPAFGIRSDSFLIINNGTSDNRIATSTIIVDTDDTNLKGYIMDYNLNHLANASVTLELVRLSSGASKNYTVTTNDKGIFILPTNLASGNYNVRVYYNGTSTYQPSKFAGSFTL